MRKWRTPIRLCAVIAIIGGLVVLWAEGRPVMAKADKDVEWTEEKIMSLTRDEVMKLWGEAPAVDMAELDGEYNGLIPNAGDEAAQKATAELMYDEDGQMGYWLGKAFTPLGKTTGDGYNRYRRPGGKVDRYYRFATKMGTSLVDGKPAFIIRYATYHLPLLQGYENTLVDELRKLDDGVYLGVGTIGRPDGTRTPPGHFVLVGPVGEWQGVDPGSEEVTPPKPAESR